MAAGETRTFLEIGGEEAAIGKYREKGRAVAARDVDQSRTHVGELAFEIGVRSFGGLCFEADA